MKNLVLRSLLILAAMTIFAVSASASSSVYAYTSVDYDSATDTVTAYSYTSHPLGGNYEPYVTATIYDEDENWIADDTFQQTEGGPASITVQATGHGCQYYHVVAWHAVDAYYYVTHYYQPGYGYSDGFYDSENFAEATPDPFFGPSPVVTYFGNGPIRIRQDEMIVLGQTEVIGSGTCTPPQLSQVLPSRGPVGTTLNIELTGSGFEYPIDSVTLTPATGITVSDISFIDSNSASATLSIANNAAPGERSIKIRSKGHFTNQKPFLVQIPKKAVPVASPSPVLVKLDPTPGIV